MTFEQVDCPSCGCPITPDDDVHVDVDGQEVHAGCCHVCKNEWFHYEQLPTLKVDRESFGLPPINEELRLPGVEWDDYES